MSNQKLAASTVSGLATKLDEFAEVLTTEEKAVLLGLLSAASATIESGHKAVEAEGGSGALSGMHSNIEMTGNLPRLSDALRASFTKIDIGGGEVQDSVGVGVSSVSWTKDYNKDLAATVTNPIDRVRLPQIAGLKTIR